MKEGAAEMLLFFCVHTIALQRICTCPRSPVVLYLYSRNDQKVRDIRAVWPTAGNF